ncbi:MAG: LysM domain-containing protein [Caldilineaceae bacterium]|nr:LysM domain-containing protein [Caldilineaceae bacterium]
MIPADISPARSTWRPQRASMATLLVFLFSLFMVPMPVFAAPAERPTPRQAYFHIVRPGESLVNIAAVYGISVEDLRAANNLVNRAQLVRCTPNADSTQAKGTVRVNGQPANGFRVVFSWHPDETVVAMAVSGGGGQEGGQYSHILGGGAREGNWWFWIENSGGIRISEMAHVHTDKDAHEGKCQRAVIDFDIQDPGQTYVGRRLQIPLVALPVAAKPLPRKPAGTKVVFGHIVRSGETLASIAEVYGATVQDLRSSNKLVNRATVVRCDANAGSTRAQGTVRLNGHPVNDYPVAFSWQPDGDVVARKRSSKNGQYTHILLGSGPREGHWWFWVENKDGQRISEMAYVHTDKNPQAGNCQQAVIDFDIQNPHLTYIGRKLHIPSTG